MNTQLLPPPVTTWEYTPCFASRCLIKVADIPEYPEFWARPLVGQTRQAVEVVTPEETFYVDNEDGTGWLKVTEAPEGSFRPLAAEGVICYLD